ncbi:SPOR domain-containing protein [Roseateles amylovorans]|uniref:SPOR domain-containing protein n=1 Tax=Roseateles amylovorans TaxID=2978473 RepID=A0ABY6AZJ0_9BURK|nr:SPOR domain-containing protein [Roseateles amylovorans]UXH78107.1 SPOR domain-containing protein [Roseateles amylovorans]
MSKDKQRGGFAMGLIVGLLLGLGIALGVALYVTKAPVPFVNKLPQRTAEQDAQEAERNKNWDPNAPLAGRAGGKTASGVVTPAQPPANTPPAATGNAGNAATAGHNTGSGGTPAAQGGAFTPPAVEGRPAERASAARAETRTADTAKPADTARPADGTRSGSYFVQAGAFTRMEDAEQQRAKLAIQGFSAKVMEREQSGRTVYRVRMGPFDSRDEAEGQQKKLESAGVEANLVAAPR